MFQRPDVLWHDGGQNSRGQRNEDSVEFSGLRRSIPEAGRLPSRYFGDRHEIS